MKSSQPIPPKHVVKLMKLWPHARNQGYKKGERWRIGYYSKQDGLDLIWLVDSKGNFHWTVDHNRLHNTFEFLNRSDEDDFYGDHAFRYVCSWLNPHYAKVQWLMEQGADVNASTNDGMTPETSLCL